MIAKNLKIGAKAKKGPRKRGRQARAEHVRVQRTGACSARARTRARRVPRTRAVQRAGACVARAWQLPRAWIPRAQRLRARMGAWRVGPRACNCSASVEPTRLLPRANRGLSAGFSPFSAAISSPFLLRQPI